MSMNLKNGYFFQDVATLYASFEATIRNRSVKGVQSRHF